MKVLGITMSWDESTKWIYVHKGKSGNSSWKGAG